MRSQRGSRLESVFVPRHGRRLPSALSLLAISACILLGALLLGVVAPAAQAVGTGDITGTVTAKDGGALLANINVSASVPDGQGGWNNVSGTQTASLSLIHISEPTRL